MEVEILSPNANVCESTLHIIIGNAISSGERAGIAPIRRGLFDGFVVIGVADIVFLVLFFSASPRLSTTNYFYPPGFRLEMMTLAILLHFLQSPHSSFVLKDFDNVAIVGLIRLLFGLLLRKNP